MAFHLYGMGKLVEGVDKEEAVKAIGRITRLSEENVCEFLLNGQRRKLASKEDKGVAEQYREILLKAGLAVEMVSDEGQGAEGSQKATGGSPVAPRKPLSGTGKAHSRLAGRLLTGVALLLVILGVLAATGWYWLNRPISGEALAIESALGDGSLVAIGHVDVERIVTLKAQWFGEADPSPLPLPEGDQALLNKLFSGDPNFRENLEHAFFAIHTLGEQKGVESTLVLKGRFDDEAIRTALASDYEFKRLGSGRWSLTKRQEPAEKGFSCPGQKTVKAAQQAKPRYLRITPQWLLLSGSEAQAQHIGQRLVRGEAAEQSLEAWRRYRGGQLASFMVFIPADASKAVNGIPGMVAQKAASDAPHISDIAARVGVAPLSAGLHADLRVSSSDGEWNRDKASRLRQGLDEWSQDSQGISPALGRLLSRITVQDSPERLQVGLDLDGEVLSEIGQTFQEAITRLFTPKISISSGGRPSEGPVVDEIMQSPTDYEANIGFDQLPAYEPDKYGPPPLFIDGSFAASLESIKRTEAGLFELVLKGGVALPKVDKFREGKLTIRVDEVKDSTGAPLMRDERCIEMPAWVKANHDPVETTSLFGNKATVDKSVRLQEGVAPEDVAVINGRLGFTAPVRVERLPVPAVPGEHIEHAGLRFFVGGIGEDGRVSFQVSGEKQRFLELRALNSEGKPLRSDWMMGSADKGRMTQHFRGRIKSLEVYIAERFVDQSVRFTLTDLFVPPSEAQSVGKHWFAPKAVSPEAWQQYAGLDMNRLHADPDDKKWHRWGGKGEIVASLLKSPIALDLIHEVREWGNSPEAELYYPMLPDLPGVLSAVSYRIEEPAREETGVERYVRISYPYESRSKKSVLEHRIDGQPLARQRFPILAGLEKSERLKRLKGVIRFRLPTQTSSRHIPLDALWEGERVGAVTVTLTEMDRGMFPGYELKLEGALDRLVNLHGLGPEGEWIAPSQINFQNGGYWTMTLPFTEGMEAVELVLAAEQKVYEYPFDLKPRYPE